MEAQDLAGAQKKCAAQRRLIVFIDESGLSERPTRVRTWAPKGCTPIVQSHFNWKHVSAVAGLTRSNFLFRLYDGAVKSAQIVEFLQALRAQLKRKLLIVWHGAAQHKSRIVRAYLDSTRAAIQMACCRPTRRTSTRSNTCGPGSSVTRWPTSVRARWPSSRPPRATSCAAVSTGKRSSLRAGSKPSCGDVMAYEKLNRCHMTCRAYETTMVRRV